MKMREYKFTLEDVLFLLHPGGLQSGAEEKIVISEGGDEDTWGILPYSSSLLWTSEILKRKVECIDVTDEMIHIWLVSKEG